jgi:hypothetical protein
LSWLKIDDGFSEHPKVDALTDRAHRIHVDALCYCSRNLTDGQLTAVTVRGVKARRRATQKHIDELVGAGLWVPYKDGYLVKAFLEYNPTAAEVKEKRAARAEAGRLGGLASGEARREANASANGSSDRSTPSPVPSLGVLLQLLDKDRLKSCEALLERIRGGDAGTPRVVATFCKQLPKERIDRVTSTLRPGVGPAIAVSALKREVQAYEAEVAA